MKSPFSHVGCALAVSLLLGAVALTGCSGVVAIPDTILPGAASHPGPIQGSVFGGHAPLVGSHVYVLEAATSAYAAASTSKLTTGDGTDANGTYVLTDGSGAFNITGDYTCDSGHPVYLAAVGGSSFANPSIPIISATFTETGSSGKYTIVFTANNTLVAGQAVTFSGLSVANGYSQLNGTTLAITAATATTVTIQVTLGHNSLSGSTTGYIIFGPSTAVTNLATLGNCPSSGNFSTTGNGAISFVYMNEVSTVATAYAFAGFGSGPFNVGAPTTNLVGIQNAATNANQLYDIEGLNISTTQDGDDHIARLATPAGNGIVPQEALDTLANILASCIDSSGPTSSQCTTLFEYATSTGATSGTKPTNTATAAFNIAHFPGGANNNSAAFMTNLYALQSSGVVPYTPNFTTQPNDFSIAIEYPSSSNADMGNPESIAVDGSGNVFFSNQSTGFITKLLPTGAISFNFNTGETPGYLSIDPSGNVWYGAIGAGSPIDEISNAGVLKGHTASSFSTVSAAATDSTGNFYFITAAPALDVYKLTSTLGNAANSPFSASGACIPTDAGFDTYDHLAIDASQELWVADEHGGEVCRFSTTGTAVKNFPVDVGANSFPEAIAIDANAAAWVSLKDDNEVDQITIHNGNGAVTVNTLTSSSTGATFNGPFSAAIDGADNVWVTNGGSNSITELTNAGAAISPLSNYQAGSGILSDPLNAAIDGSGNVWITNYTGQEVVELMGAAAPTVTPLSLASGAGGLGSKP